MKSTTLPRIVLVAAALALFQVPAWSQGDKIVTNFTLTDVDGAEASLYAELDAGRHVLLDFFSPYCHFCKENTSKVNQMQMDYDGRLTIWKLNVEPQNRADLEDVVNFNEWYASEIRSFSDALETTSYFRSEFGLGFGTPGYVLVAPDRTVEFVYGGFRENTLRSGLNEAGLSPTSVTDRPDVSAEINLAPQPATDVLTVDVPVNKQLQQLTIADAQGNIVAMQTRDSGLQVNGALSIDIGSLETASGVHFLRLEFADNTIAQKSVMIVR